MLYRHSFEQFRVFPDIGQQFLPVARRQDGSDRISVENRELRMPLPGKGEERNHRALMTRRKIKCRIRTTSGLSQKRQGGVLDFEIAVAHHAEISPRSRLGCFDQSPIGRNGDQAEIRIADRRSLSHSDLESGAASRFKGRRNVSSPSFNACQQLKWDASRRNPFGCPVNSLIMAPF